MVKKIAIFVEGQTEQLFVVKLIQQIAGKRGVTFEIKKQFEGSLLSDGFISVGNAQYYVLVVNCCTDSQLKSQINANYASLCSAGYSYIIGLRDAYPLFNHSTLGKSNLYLRSGVPTGVVPISLHLAVMEIEAWFLEEISHFQRVDARLNAAQVAAAGFDRSVINSESLPTPAQTLHTVYQSVGLAYGKSKKQVSRVVNNLCYESMYLDVTSRCKSFDHFVKKIELALSL